MSPYAAPYQNYRGSAHRSGLWICFGAPITPREGPPWVRSRHNGPIHGTEARVRSAIISLRRQGHNIIATGRVFILFTNEEDVSSAISVRHAAYSTHRVLAALRDAPLGLTLAMLAADLGLSQVQVQTAIHNLRLHHGHNIEKQGGKQGPGGRPGTFHLVTEPAPPAS